MITDFSPLLSQVAMTDSIGHKSMGVILKRKLSEMEGSMHQNQYLAFLLVFVLADVDLEGNLDLVKELMSTISIPVLKTMIYFKLNYYMAFKAGGKAKLQAELSNMIKDQRHNMDSGLMDNAQQKSLNDSRKRSNALARKGRL